MGFSSRAHKQATRARQCATVLAYVRSVSASTHPSAIPLARIGEATA
jgi:hypothetical protein